MPGRIKEAFLIVIAGLIITVSAVEVNEMDYNDINQVQDELMADANVGDSNSDSNTADVNQANGEPVQPKKAEQKPQTNGKEGAAFGPAVIGYHQAAWKIREKYVGDRHRPKFHYSAPENWLNDTNGALYYKGKYHLFYQYNPDGVYWGNIHWGHAASLDLVHWVDMPAALAPTPDGPDRLGCWSGGAVSNCDIPTQIYFGQPDGVCIARSTDEDLVTWVKDVNNPVIKRGSGEGKYAVFDSCAWKEGDIYYALTGGRKPGGRGDATFLFKSNDLVNWEYMHIFHAGIDSPEAEDCVVPDFFPLGDKHMMLFASHLRGAQYYIGTYSDNKFTPEIHGRFCRGRFGCGNYSAGRVLIDDKGRRIMLGWIPEGRDIETQKASGWAGVVTLPWVLSLGEDGSLRIKAAEELQKLRGKKYHFENMTVASGEEKLLEGVSGDCLEIIAEIEHGDYKKAGIKVRCSSDGREESSVVYEKQAQTLTLDVSKSTLDTQINTAEEQCFFTIGNEALRLHVFVDRSVIELVGNDREYLGKRVYPTLGDSLGVKVFSDGGDAVIKSLEVWEINGVWPEQ